MESMATLACVCLDTEADIVTRKQMNMFLNTAWIWLYTFNEIKRYTCVCSQKYSCVNCDFEIDECGCQLCLPCSHVKMLVHLTLCTWSPWKPRWTQFSSSAKQQCLHGGLCLDKGNNFHCNRMDTGFTGTYCESVIPLYWAKPCHNNVICENIVES